MNQIRGSRPFPIDHERQKRCAEMLTSLGMTITELAMHMGTSRQYISNLLSGRNLSPDAEARIAGFFGVPVSSLFPPRTAGEIAFMREAEAREKAEAERKRNERMALRERELSKLKVSA